MTQQLLAVFFEQFGKIDAAVVDDADRRTAVDAGQACTQRFECCVVDQIALADQQPVGKADLGLGFGRKALDSLGIGAINHIPAPQIEATLALLTALKTIFTLTYFGGHKESPFQDGEGKICPGHIGMELARMIRIKTQLLAPPTL